MSETTPKPAAPSAPATPTPAAKTEGSASAKEGIQNGKGDVPRNISRKFVKNYEQIKWTSGGAKRKEGSRYTKVY